VEIPTQLADLVPEMARAHARLQQALRERGYEIPEYPASLPPPNPEGEAAALAYPIQGILKYHGMADWTWRTAYLPSISVNNDAAYTVTLVQFDPDLQIDEVVINGQVARGRARERVLQSLAVVRRLTGLESRARVRSRNVVRASITGKGLGTSASASAALATAALAAACGPDIIANTRLLSCLARLLAGSGCRSAVGGIGLWLSYPGITHEDSYAVRLDRHNELADIRLLTIPIASRIGLQTEQAHRDAPRSTLYGAWMRSREAEVIECLEAVLERDWRTIGQMAELDSVRLHGITMSGSRENKLFAWEPENIPLFRLCNELRDSGTPVYFSTDTGPTTVLITHQDHAADVIAAVKALDLGLEIIAGRIAGPAQLLPLDTALALLEKGESKGPPA